MKKTPIILILSLILCTILMGCRKDEEPVIVTTETASDSIENSATSIPETVATEQSMDELIASLPYKTGRMGVYVMADPSLVSSAEVLDSITFNATDGDVELTRYRVSNSQHDLIKNGMQIGGFMVIDIPREMQEEAANSFDGFKALADYVGKLVLPDVYPEKAVISGGGHITGGTHNSFVSISFEMGEGKNTAQQWHRIYIGENYCYDFWQDKTWFADCGGKIRESLVAEDIKPEWNRDAIFNWTIEEVQEQGKFVF